MTRAALLASLLLAAGAAAQPAEPMRLLEARPAARSIMTGSLQEFFLRFDRPVDHNRSRLEVVQDGQVVRTLQPRLQAQPNVLFATAGSLPAGAYSLRWHALGTSDNERAEGSFEFSVQR